MAATTGRTEGR